MSAKHQLLLALLFSLFGSKPHEPKNDRPQLVLSGACIKSIETTPQTSCHGQDLQHMSCEHIKITYVAGCEVWEIGEYKFLLRGAE